MHLVTAVQKDPEREPLPQTCFKPKMRKADVRSRLSWVPLGGVLQAGSGSILAAGTWAGHELGVGAGKHCQVSPFSNHLFAENRLVISDLIVC